jgi:prepilin signal peptidase PulO-like enzyme (type II secretory pathway)
MMIMAMVLLGLCFGSFVNAWVWRLHEQSKPKKKRAASDNELSITRGRSMCPYCKHTLAVKDLLPVISWLTLGGKCRYCKKPISWQYPLVETLTALLFVIAYLSWPDSLNNWSFGVLQIAVFLSAIVVGMALAVYDFKWMLLPDKLVKIFSSFALIYAGLHMVNSDNTLSTVFQLVLSVFVSGGIFYVLYQISNGKWIGGGDVKLGFPLGLFLLTPSSNPIFWGSYRSGCVCP